jgi:protein TonB
LPSSLGSPEEKEHWATLSYGRFSSFQVLGPEEDTRDNFSLGVPSPVRERNFRRKLIPIGASAAVLALALGTGAFLARRSRRAPVEAASLSLPTTPAPEQPSPVFQPQPTDNPAAESVQIPPQPPPSASVNSNNQPNQSSKQASPEPTAIVASHPKSQTPPASAPTPKPSFKLAPNAAIPQRAPVSRETLPPPAAADEVATSPGTAGISSSITPDALRNDAEVPPPPPEKIPEKTPEKIGGDVKLPQLLRMVPPSYPLSAKQAGLQGEVTLQASVDTTGKVVGAKVVSGPVLLQQAAVDAVRQWKYAPATLDGKPVSMQVVVKVKFHLN